MDAELWSLLERPAWVRRLAVEIARSGDAAEDLVQDTWLAALARPPQRGAPVRRWFARVMRNRARDRARTDAARAERERARSAFSGATHPGSPPLDPATLLERLELSRAVAAAVRSLEEPYRSTILLRFFEELPPQEIARRTATPVRTVHSRVHRGLKLLRQRLAPPDGERRREWRAAMLGLAGSSGSRSGPVGAGRAAAPSAAAVTGVIVMGTKLKWVAAVVAAAGIVVYARLGKLRDGRSEGDAGGPAAGGMAEIVAPATEEAGTREAAVAPAPRASESPDEDLPYGTLTSVSDEPDPITGRVIDATGLPVPGVSVLASPFGQGPVDRVTSDGTGRFTLANPPGNCVLDAAPPWVTLLEPRLLEDTGRGAAVLVVAPAIDLAGSVSDPDGRPLPGARIEVLAPDDLRVSLPAVLDDSHTLAWSATSDAEGLFTLEGAPAVAGGTLAVTRPGYREARWALPLAGDTGLTLVLEPEGEPPARLQGRVVTAQGEPVPEAWIALGGSCARSGEGGGFELVLDDPRGARTVVAQATGWLPARLEGSPGVPLAQAFPDPIVLVLSERPRVLAGRVLDDAGRPVQGVEVWTPDGRDFGVVQPDEDNEEWRQPVAVEDVARGEAVFGGEVLSTDADGRFELDGLEDRPYTVVGFDPIEFRWAQSEATRPGQPITLRLPRGAGTRRVSGRLTSLGGRPIAGVEVGFGVAFSLARRHGGSPRESQRFDAPVVTDGEGRFTADGVPLAANRVHLDGGGLAWVDDLELGPHESELDLVLPLLCHVRVEAEGTGAEWIEIEDADGARLPLRAKHGWIETATLRRDLDGGRSEILRVSEAGRMLILGAGQEELARIPVELLPGSVQVLRP